MLRRALLLIASVIVFSNLSAQDIVEPDSRLYEVYTEQQMQNWMENNQTIIQLKNAELEFGYKIKTMPDDKITELPYLYKINPMDKTATPVKVSSIEKESFNLYLYKYERDYNSSRHYRIGDTNKVLEIVSHKELADLTNKKLNYE